MRWLILLGLLASLPSESVLADDTPRKIKPVVVWSGKDSGVNKESFARCRSKTQWLATWKTHQEEGGQAGQLAPDIDFDSYMVLALFQGHGSQNYGLYIHEVLDEGERLRVRFVTGYYQTAGIPDSESERRKLDTQSYALVVLPDTEKQVIFEEATDWDRDRRPQSWKERGRLEAAKRK